MRYFFISDLHGCHPSLAISALEKQGFDAENDYLVVLGDIVDRGHYTNLLLEWLLSIPHLIAIKGNHDARLLELLTGKDAYNKIDKHNGVNETIASFLGEDGIKMSDSMGLQLLKNGTNKYVKLFYQYMDHACWAIEFNDLIATHAWVPYQQFYRSNKMSDYEFTLKLLPNWRTAATQKDWYEASWAHVPQCIKHNIFPDKTLLIGHWWAAELRARYEKHLLFEDYLAQADFSTFNYKDKVIAIDTCTPYSQQINVFIYTSDESPIIYGNEAAL